MSNAVEVPSLEELERDECLRLLRDHAMGRFAVAAPGAAPVVVPVNYVLDGEVVVFRTATGSKLRLLRGLPVSFELDEIDPVRHTGWSILVRGMAYEGSRWETEHLALEAWAPGDKDHWIRIVPDVITGRRILLAERSVDLGGYL